MTNAKRAWAVTMAAAVAAALAAAPRSHAEERAIRSPNDAPPGAGPFVALAHVPLRVHRRAVDFVAAERKMGMPGWSDAALAPVAAALHEPGRARPTHYELALVGPDGSPRGRLVVSDVGDDHPIAEASLAGPSVAARLVADARASGHDVARLYRLAMGVYVAEDARGEEVAHEGELAGRPEGIDPAWLDASDDARAGHLAYDGATGAREERTTAIGRSIHFSPWASWHELRDAYPTAYASMHAIRARNAAREQEAEARADGEATALFARELHDVALLTGRGEATLALRGEGASYLSVARGSDGAGGEIARVVAERAPEAGVAQAELDVRYGDGTTERVRFAIGSDAARERLSPDLLGGITVTPPPRRPGVVVRPGSGVVVAPASSSSSSSGSVIVGPPSGIPTAGLAGTMTHCPRVALRTWGGTYLRADGMRNLRADAPSPDYGFLFELTGGGIALREAAPGMTSHVTRVARPDGHDPAHLGSVTVTSRQQIFGTIEVGRTGKLAFQADSGKFLIAKPDGSVTFESPRAREWESFEPICDPTMARVTWGDPSSTFHETWRAVRKYDQIPAHRAPNDSQCASGCGATAWAMLFGWADFKASLGRGRGLGLYGPPGSLTPAPEFMWTLAPTTNVLFVDRNSAMDAGVARMTWDIRNRLNNAVVTGCAPDGGRYTAPHVMGQATQYLQGRAKLSLTADYDGLGVMTDTGRNKAIGALRDLHEPVILGIGEMVGNGHYPLGIGFGDSTKLVFDLRTSTFSRRSDGSRFVVYQGHGDSYADLVPAGTWFQGFVRR